MISAAQKQQIKLFLTDVDGVLTDGGMYYSAEGDVMKRFHVHDGMGLVLLQNSGIPIGIVTSEQTEIVAKRGEKLKLDFVRLGVKDKLPVVKEICRDLGIELKNVAYVGDDVNDLEVLKSVGLAACPANALSQIKAVHGILQLKKSGGDGAVREFTEMILNA